MRQLSELHETDPQCPALGCQQRPRAYEAVTNRAVAFASTLSPRLGVALTGAIWGPDVASAHLACGALISESGQTADWLLTCDCSPVPVAIAEHKPSLRPVPNDTPCKAADYRTAVEAGFITEPASGYPSDAHQLPHQRRDDCLFCMERKGVSRLVLPQVVVYAIRYPDVPRVLVTDFPSADAAWARWGWDEEFSMSETMMQIRRVPDVINSLAGAAYGDAVTLRERDALRAIACRLWWRTDWDAWDDGLATKQARKFIRNAEECWRQHT